MRSMLDERMGVTVGDFRHRGHHHVSRVESFSDAVFGFSLTLLVVSLTVPKTFDELLHTMAGFPAFAISFALLAQIWYHQYRFFRRYALTDQTTITLNIVLLFVVVFYTYPLKFLFGSIFAGTPGLQAFRPDQVWQLMAVYGAGYGAMFAVFALLYRHALALRAELELTPLELLETRRSLAVSLLFIGIAFASTVVAVLFTLFGQPGLAGFCGGLVYPFGITLGIGRIRRVYAARRNALVAQSTKPA